VQATIDTPCVPSLASTGSKHIILAEYRSTHRQNNPSAFILGCMHINYIPFATTNATPASRTRHTFSKGLPDQKDRGPKLPFPVVLGCARVEHGRSGLVLHHHTSVLAIWTYAQVELEVRYILARGASPNSQCQCPPVLPISAPDAQSYTHMVPNTGSRSHCTQYTYLHVL
jgi:hypothetical protein